MIMPKDCLHSGDNSNAAKVFYRSHFCEEIYVEYGDTWFTPIALLGDLKNLKQIMKICPELNNGYEKVKRFKLKLISKISEVVLNENIEGFSGCIGGDRNTPANYGFLPAGLNSRRGFGNRWRLGDFPDLFFE